MKFVVSSPTVCRENRDWRYLVALISSPVIGIAYCCAAQRDEREGYVITAALEWRHAAELMASLPAVADRCWSHWERIMHLPRRLAGPIENYCALELSNSQLKPVVQCLASQPYPPALPPLDTYSRRSRAA